jgi:hypothetical protein
MNEKGHGHCRPVANDVRQTANRREKESLMNRLGQVRLPFAFLGRKRQVPNTNPPCVVPAATVSYSNRPRRSLTLLRALNADCPSCHGLGCVDCAGTGID